MTEQRPVEWPLFLLGWVGCAATATFLGYVLPPETALRYASGIIVIPALWLLYRHMKTTARFG